MKDVLDRTGAAIALLLLSPLLLLLAALVRLSSPGSIIYRRRVVGLGGSAFDAFKFRTMVADADRILQERADLRRAFSIKVKLQDDPRITPIGSLLRRTSLDELPQLVNVLRGEMSLVGPRMISPEEMPRYGALIAKRLSVKPGLTGLWQVSGRQELDYEGRVKLDMHYIENWSLWLDFVILLKTIPAVLSMKGAH